jgi:hypothetical protein
MFVKKAHNYLEQKKNVLHGINGGNTIVFPDLGRIQSDSQFAILRSKTHSQRTQRHPLWRYGSTLSPCDLL